MTDRTLPDTPSGGRRAPRSRRPVPSRPRRRAQRVITTGADVALNELVTRGDVFDVDGHRYLVAPVTDWLAEQIAVAMAAAEDAEDDGSAEPSLGWLSGNGSERGRLMDGQCDDSESDGDCDAEDDDPDHGVDDVPHDGDPDREPDLCGATGLGLSGAYGSEGESSTPSLAAMRATSPRRVGGRRKRPDDGGMPRGRRP